MRSFVFWAALGVALIGSTANAAISGLQRVASGLSAPIFVTHAPGDRSRLFIVERGGTIRTLDLTTGKLQSASTPFLSIPNVDAEGEGGLLGMTFDPNYATNGKFYVNVTIDNGGLNFQGATSPFSSHIRQYTVSADPNIANPAATEILSYIQPQTNHNAGWIGFNPALTPGQPQYLYIPTGDGGGGNDHDNNGGDLGHTPVTGNAQDNTDNLLGKILRIDVNGGDDFPGDANRNYKVVDSNPYADVRNPDRSVNTVVTGDDEIWAIGMRNPFRDSFDRETGDLWLGDVGQSAKEEIDHQPANAPGGENFGWRLIEGKPPTPSSPPFRDPVYDYGHVSGAFGGIVVTGGYVYRGPDPDLQGKYLFLDSRNSNSAADDNYWMFGIANPTGTVANINSLLTHTTGSVQFPVSFGEDETGNLYVAYLGSGEVYRIMASIPGDYNFDGTVDAADYTTWRDALGSTTNLAADGDHSGTVDAGDYNVWTINFGHTGHTPSGSGAAVPEPATIVLAFQTLGLCAIIGLSRRRAATRRRSAFPG